MESWGKLLDAGAFLESWQLSLEVDAFPFSSLGTVLRQIWLEKKMQL